ncbi:MAG: helix-turn-helix domain-containing protein [Deltaproteobacteria bacterium]|jgi:putative transposase|nr:helix-turn-helix domain-containing protein [Deltaproteobacteria bacterium]
MRQAPIIVLTPEEKAKLDYLLRSPKTPRKLLDRAKIVNLASSGENNETIAQQLGFSEARVGKWRLRFALDRFSGIESDAPRSGRPSTVRNTLMQQVIEKTMSEPPPNHRKTWSTRLLAQVLGISHTSVHRLWQHYNLTPVDEEPAVPKRSGQLAKKTEHLGK